VISIVLAGLAAAVWGIADFSGGKASQRARPLTVTMVSQLLGLPLLAVALIIVPGRPLPADLAWGAAGGVAGFLGIVLLYKGLSRGAMSVVAPVTAVTAAVIPMTVGLVTDRWPGTLALTGAGCALVAIALVSLGPSGTGGRGVVTAATLGLALGSGALFGLFFALLGQVSQPAGMWSLVAVRVGSIGCGVLLMLRTRASWRLPKAVLPWAVAAGALDVAANAAYIAAAVRGHLSVVAAIASLYPASTVLLAVTVDRERLRPIQIVGLGLAATALVLASA
jgi:drug/metabolite transporter (DMT)-like permease